MDVVTGRHLGRIYEILDDLKRRIEVLEKS